MIQKKTLRFLLRAFLGILLLGLFWKWLGEFPQPLLLSWSDFQITTTLRLIALFFLALLALLIFLISLFKKILKKIGFYQENSFLKTLFQVVLGEALEDQKQMEKNLKILEKNKIKTPLVPWLKVRLKEKMGIPVIEEERYLRSFPEARDLVTQMAIKEALKRKDQESAWSLRVAGFEAGEKNPWLLKDFFQEALQRNDLKWATLLFQKIRKSPSPPQNLTFLKAQLLLCQARAQKEESLYQEFLLWQAHELSPENIDVTLSLLRSLEKKGKEKKFLQCLQKAWTLSPDIRLAAALFRSFHDTTAHLRFQKVQTLLGNWTSETKERRLTSALVLGYAAALAGLETSLFEAINELTEERPLWAVFLRILSIQNSQEFSPDLLEIRDQMINELRKTDTCLRELTETFPL
jgi:uncharacterized membrane-anchored protein